MTKTYATKATALRAAKALGAKLSDDALLVAISVIAADDKFTAVFAFENHELSAEDVAILEGFEIELAPAPIEPDAKLDEATDAAMAEGAREGRKSGYINERSAEAGSVARVWAIADANPEMKRKDVVELCRANGIAFGTARTQYQKWFVARRDAALRAAAETEAAANENEADDDAQQMAAAEWEGMGQAQ